MPYVGEWHLLFTFGQWLCDQVWDGGPLKVAAKLGMPGMKPQAEWRDTHRVLMTTWAALNRLFMSQYVTHKRKGHQGKSHQTKPQRSLLPPARRPSEHSIGTWSHLGARVAKGKAVR